ncbi:serine/threonine-protein kinase [Streptomyces sp. NBC_01257]|uniref:serine/threonine-protein kinase n=1 Tax=Streptomyces sp. NBC_01257 TaxID=2903799 RepID=UPI002DD8E4BF|nr:serine/threonine-protein kinase [Streptomyces sp. NBC_01257]WRZ66457.1 serine/threonine protein kinase [Streptomyces sp. NBC_01257]
MRGEVLDGRYRLTEPVGSGGMGRVWLAEDERIGRKVAVKVLSRPDGDTSATRFAREARVVGGLSSPHIVTLHDFGEARVAGERVLYLVLEHLQGRDLGAVLEGSKPDLPSPEEVLGWGVEICAGLETAHRAGIVHRDIKPANILLTAAGTIKILDFGIARMLSTAAEMTRTDLTAVGFVIGTPLYMSPEQIRAPDVLDSRSDLYSLGCLLHTLLTGAPPFTGAGTAVLAQHLGDVPQPLSARRAELAGFGGLDALVMRLLSKEPDQRPADAAETAALLRAAIAAGPGRAAPSAEAEATPSVLGSVAHSDSASPAAPAPAAPVLPAPQVAYPTAPPTAPFPQPMPSYPFPLPGGPQPATEPERLRIAGRTSRDGTVSTRTVAATWLAGAGTALVMGLLLMTCTPAGPQAALLGTVAAGLGGMAAAQGFTNIFDPQDKSLFHRFVSALLLALPLGIAGTAMNQAATDEVSTRFIGFAFVACLAALTLGVLLADQLIARLGLSPRAALILSMSGWVNGLVAWGMLAYRSPLETIGALPVACGIWIVTAALLGQILAPSGHRNGRTV